MPSIHRKPGLANISPEWEEFVKQFPYPPLLGTPSEMRRGLDSLPKPPKPVGFSITDVSVPAYDGAAGQARIYKPETPSTNGALLIYVHGGGWTLGNLDSEDAVCRTLCDAARIVVVSLDYRKAPENPFPIGLEDVWEGILWILRVPLVVHPTVQPAGVDFSSYEENAEAPILPTKMVMQFLEWYNPVPDDVRMSPLLAKDFSGLPPAYLQIAGADPLRDDGFDYMEKLEEAGVPVRVSVYPGLPHAFMSVPIETSLHYDSEETEMEKTSAIQTTCQQTVSRYRLTMVKN
ncbi:hypothetical protein CEP51_012796 [Fusarium floridanum]|uniref:Alpha/beta hydrolase fold-3 domain-containing protein n=1 Tax=Fusarium floridanum TaxID=1325733 RepID=A0A428QMV0_9HYPO|nr:hypothetical protein CEP51_012796 [Fusarium floridanum]